MRELDRAAESAGLTPAHHWTDYPDRRGAVNCSAPASRIEPPTCSIRSTVPEGSGLSSSAALEVSSRPGASGRPRRCDPLDLARLCQRAERDFVGMPCGIMDQYISVFGREHAAVEIDCRSLEHRYVALPDGVAFLAVNTMVKHALAGSAYQASACEECAAAVAAIRRRFPRRREPARRHPGAVRNGRRHRCPHVIARRGRHVVTENERVGRFVEAAAAATCRAHGRA